MNLNDYYSKYYSEFVRQARSKLTKWSFYNKGDEYELISFIYITIHSKEPDLIDRLIKEDRLKDYIFKIIDTNTKYLSSPFLISKNTKFLPLFDQQSIITEESIDSLNSEVLDRIQTIFANPEILQTIFKRNWRYYRLLYYTYIDHYDISPFKIGKKYNLVHVPLHLRYMWKKLRLYLLNENFILNKNN